MRYTFETWAILVSFNISLLLPFLIRGEPSTTTSHNEIFQLQQQQETTTTNSSTTRHKMTQPSSVDDNRNEFQTLLHTVTKNVTKIIHNYDNIDAIDIPEQLWQLDDRTSSTEDYKTQVTKQVTPDDITTLQQKLDNLETYQQIKLKNKEQSPIIGITDIDTFNSFITDITKKGIRERENTQKMTSTDRTYTTVNTRPSVGIYTANRLKEIDDKQTNQQILTDTSNDDRTQDVNKNNSNATEQTLQASTSTTTTSTNTLTNTNDSDTTSEINQNKTTTSTAITSTTEDAPLTTFTTNKDADVDGGDIEDDNDGHIEQILSYYMSSVFNATTNDSVVLNADDTTQNDATTLIELPSPINLQNKTHTGTGNEDNKWDKVGKNNDTSSAAHLVSRDIQSFQLKEIQEAVDYGMEEMNELYMNKEPKLFEMGLWLEKDNPAHYVAMFNSQSEKARNLAKFGYISLRATTRLISQIKTSESRAASASALSELTPSLRQTTFHDLCPLRGPVRCSPASRRYRTADGTCNNLREPRRGSAFMPMMRFLSPSYSDDVESVRRSVVRNRPLPSARLISTVIHGDRNIELTAVTHMLMAWGQFLDHDIIQSAQSRGFNGSVPRCCTNGGADFQPFENMHPDCLPIEVPPFDRFLGRFGIRCMEFVRSSPASRVDCSLGWREQINQVTAYIDASHIYGSSIRQAESLRTFRDGQLAYARSNFQTTTDEAERCHRGANSATCFQSGDSRASEQPGLTSMHIVWVRQHNLIASILARENLHWSDEKIYQETRRIIGAMIQHITYHEFLPIILGPEVMDSFGLQLLRKGYYDKYDPAVNPGPANSFAAAAFRFGHSLVQHSFMRADRNHRFLPDNVTLHDEPNNVDNVWSFGSADRMLLGMCNQPSQKRDEFISEELTNHLFQTSRFGFGMDLASINIQRGRDHGIPSYTAWRTPCGLSAVNSWSDLERIMSLETVGKLQSLYSHFDDIDLFTGGLSEKPVRGGLVGPTFACIIAQQFSNLRVGDRFWYENGNLESSFTLPQLQQIRKITLSQVLCSSMKNFETLQPFVFLTIDNFRNERLSCDDPTLNNFDLTPWIERRTVDVEIEQQTIIKKTESTTVVKDVTTETSILKKIQSKLNKIVDKLIPKSDNDSTTNLDDTIILNHTAVKRTSLFPGELFKLEMAQLRNEDTHFNRDKSRDMIRLDFEIGPQLTTPQSKQLPDNDENRHGFGSEDWYDEFPISKKPYLPPQRDFFTTPSYYGTETSSTRRPPPSSSNPFLDELDVTYEIKRKKPKPEDLTYLVNVASNDVTTERKFEHLIGLVHHHHKPQIDPYDRPQNTLYGNSKPQYSYDSYYYTRPTRPYGIYTQSTTKRYTIRPQTTYYPQTQKPKPFPTARPTQNTYGQPVTERPVYNYNKPYAPLRPVTKPDYYYTNAPSYYKPQKPYRPQLTDDDPYNAVYGQIQNPNYGRPTRPTNQYDYHNDPNFYGNRDFDKATGPETTDNRDEFRPRPISKDEPIKLYYIRNKLHKIRGNYTPSTTISSTPASSQKSINTKFVKISSVSGYKHWTTNNPPKYVDINVNNKQADDLEIDESVHLHEAIQSTVKDTLKIKKLNTTDIIHVNGTSENEFIRLPTIQRPSNKTRNKG